MAKTTENGNTTPAGMNVPDGYKEQKSDLSGFWNPEEGPIHFVPRYVHLVDNGADETKHSTLIIGELFADNAAMVGPDREQVLCRKGELVGVWYKPGMKGVLKAGGVPTYIYRDEASDKDTGKPNPMQGFKVFSKGGGQGIPIEADYRKSSFKGDRLTGQVLTA